MDIIETELLLTRLDEEIKKANSKEIEKLKKERKEVLKRYENLTAWDRVCIARSPRRPKAIDYINAFITSFTELHGDQYYKDDASLICGIGHLNDLPITVIAQAKGKTLEENLKRNFGMPEPDGFRKALRLAKQAEKFNRPILTIIDTSGAYPGKGAEERGQSKAIADCLLQFSTLNTPIIALVIGEGGSGGALALTISDKILMLENSVYSILSPEGFASILFKNDAKVAKTAELMKLTAKDLVDENIVDILIKEPVGGIQRDFNTTAATIKDIIYHTFLKLKEDADMLNHRYLKFRSIGAKTYEA